MGYNQAMNIELEPLIADVATLSQAEIGIKETEIEEIKSNIIQEGISRLFELGWTDDEVRDLLFTIFVSGDEVRIGVFGSMSRGKQTTENRDPQLARDNSDIDIVIESVDETHIWVTPGKFSQRKLNLIVFPHSHSPRFFQSGLNNYSEIIWVYENTTAVQVLRVERMLQAKTQEQINQELYGF